MKKILLLVLGTLLCVGILRLALGRSVLSVRSFIEAFEQLDLDYSAVINSIDELVHYDWTIQWNGIGSIFEWFSKNWNFTFVMSRLFWNIVYSIFESIGAVFGFFYYLLGGKYPIGGGGAR